MKEAAGEANMTVITIVLIAIVLAVGTVIINNLMNNTQKSAACTSAGFTWSGGKCYKSGCETDESSGRISCTGTDTASCTSNSDTEGIVCE